MPESAYRYAIAVAPAEILRNEASDQRREMRSVRQKERKNAHVKPSFVHEVKIAYRRRSDRRRTPGRNAIDRPRHHLRV